VLPTGPGKTEITADRVQLQQVLMNLMLNGIEAMKVTGGVLIRFALSPTQR
jgi:signal transduction histidine kinase